MINKETILEWHNNNYGLWWLEKSPELWEYKHNFIQWMFPTKTASKCNAEAPVLYSSIEEDLTVQAKAIYVGNYYLFLQYLEEYGKLPFNHWILRASRVIESTQLCVSKFLPIDRVIKDICSRMSPENLQGFFKHHFQNRTGYEVLIGNFLAYRDMNDDPHAQSLLFKCLEAHTLHRCHLRSRHFFLFKEMAQGNKKLEALGIKVEVIEAEPDTMNVITPIILDCRW
jgi:hypothetical protein